MKKPLVVSPAFVKQWRPGDETDPVARALVSRCYWVGPQDHGPAVHDFRRRQLFGFGLVEEEQLTAALASLEERRALISPADAAAELEPDHAAERAQVIEAQAGLATIARLAETVAGDVGGMGNHALTACPDLVARLAAVESQLQAITDELYAARAGFLAEQTERLGIDGKRDLKLHLGAGPTRLPGWVNSDIAPSELSFNLSWGLPVADGTVAFAFAGHVFEHLYFAGEALQLLREVRRVLQPGGVFRFQIPDMGLFLERYAADDREFFAHWRKHATKMFGVFETPMETVMMYSQVGRAASEFFAHKMGYDFETIEKLAHRAGFTTVTRSDYMASEHPELQVDSVSTAANLSYEGRRYSLFIELSN
ncbi:MAG: methyltransferase domain-containing protein [Kofleriaceae bacterium]